MQRQAAQIRDLRQHGWHKLKDLKQELRARLRKLHRLKMRFVAGRLNDQNNPPTNSALSRNAWVVNPRLERADVAAAPHQQFSRGAATCTSNAANSSHPRKGQDMNALPLAFIGVHRPWIVRSAAAGNRGCDRHFIRLTLDEQRDVARRLHDNHPVEAQCSITAHPAR